MVREVMLKVRRERPWFKSDGSQAAKPRVEYLCSVCGDWYMGKDIQVDHKNPVVDPEVGFQSWDVFISRLFCDIDNLSVICKSDHRAKTDSEKAVAVERRRLDKLVPRYENGQIISDPKDIEKWHKLNDEPPKHLKKSKNR
jgi:5-methylcytosine-specific restriction endonuclease McrA